MKNPFFKNNGPFKINEILNDLKLNNINNLENDLIKDVKDLQSAEINDLTFFHSKKYHPQASKTKASFCITLNSLKHYLPNSCNPICVDFC